MSFSEQLYDTSISYEDFPMSLGTFDTQDLQLCSPFAPASPHSLYVAPQYITEPPPPPSASHQLVFFGGDFVDASPSSSAFYLQPSFTSITPSSSSSSNNNNHNNHNNHNNQMAPIATPISPPSTPRPRSISREDLPTSVSHDNFSEKSYRGDSEEGDYGSVYEDEDSQDEDLPQVVRKCPSIQVIHNKPKRGGRRKKDAKPREELLPPPSPETLNDPERMQEYRQERNRLAAKRSRERKKDYVSELEETCQALKDHNDELSKELLKMRKELQEIRARASKKSY